MIRFLSSVGVQLVCIFVAVAAEAGIFVPAGLHPGYHYYLAFITHGTRDATSVNIGDYNQFVQAQAAQNPALTGTDQGVQWRAIASTPTVSANDNLGLIAGIPIYLPINLSDDGNLVTADASSLLSSPTLHTYIFFDQFDQESGDRAWTGTQPGGATGGPNSLGGASGTPLWGLPTPEPFDRPFAWLTGIPIGFTLQQTDASNFYAVSTLLTVPEPPTSALLLLGGGALLSSSFWLRRRAAV